MSDLFLLLLVIAFDLFRVAYMRVGLSSFYLVRSLHDQAVGNAVGAASAFFG